jgi:hypothetical protein
VEVEKCRLRPPIPFIDSILIPSLRQSCRMALVSFVISAMAWSAGLGGVCAALIFLIVKLGESRSQDHPCHVCGGRGSDHGSKCRGGHKALAHN